jgi:signal transduction histidine kinase
MYPTPRALLVSHMPLGARRAIAWSAARHLVKGAVPGDSYWWSLLAVAVSVAVTAYLVRRRPWWVLAFLLCCCVAVTATPQSWRIGLFLPLLPLLLLLLVSLTICVIAATRPPRTSIAATVVAAGVVAGCVTALARPANLQALTFGVTILIGWLIGNSIRQSHTHAEVLRDRAEAQAVTAERLRIARELHDMVAHSIGIIAIQAGAGGRVIDTQPAEARNALAAIETTSRETLAGLRRMLGALRQAEAGVAAPLDPALGLAGVGKLAATTADAGVLVEVQWHGQQSPLPTDIDTSAFRIIQEAVTNVVRHAGTGHCQVSIDHQDDELSIEVVDDGRGGAVMGGGYGIAGMRERVALLHGQFTAGPRPGGGFRVAARLPVPTAAL